MYYPDYKTVLQRELLLDVQIVDLYVEKSIRQNKSLIETLLSEEIVTFENIAIVLQAEWGIVSFSPDTHIFTEDALGMIPADLAKKHNAIPIFREPDSLFVAMADPFHRRTLEDFEEVAKTWVVPLFARSVEVERSIGKYYGRDLFRALTREHDMGRSSVIRLSPTDMAGSAAPAVKMADCIIASAVAWRASDIHIEPFEESVRIRFRVDGRLQIFDHMDCKWMNSLASRLKIMGEMDISEKRLPQDGHFTQIIAGEKIYFRLSTITTTYGEKVVLRMIYGQSTLPDLDSLGFFPDDIQRLQGLLKSFGGAVLLCGPTGCGKTTTLSAILELLNKDDVNIVTVEDPVENLIQGTNQIGVNPKAGLHFANALRAILRQDPDIIMVGEIRDAETASLAIRSAITGHLVLSTLHTNDAVSVVPRLVDMGVESYMVYSALCAVVSQRLVRRICNRCKRQTSLSSGEAALLGLSASTCVYAGAGCHYCNFTGYQGRFAIYEILVMDDDLRLLFADGRHLGNIKAFLLSRGERTLLSCGVKNILLGNTTAAEVCRMALE